MTKLDGLKPLQIKILMYCLGTDTADIMRPIVKSIIQENPDKPITAWNYYMPQKYTYSSVYKKANMPNYGGYIVNHELRLARNTEDKEFEQQLNKLKSAQLRLKYTILNDKETIHGTPTCIIIRNYMTKLSRQGIKLREERTLWALHSYGQLLDKYRKPMTHLLKSVESDLFIAFDEYMANF